MTSRDTTRQLTGKHVLMICLGFFGVMLAANAIFVIYALSTFNGGEGGRAYQSGLEYNQVIDAAKAQEALGWSHGVEAATSGAVRVRLKDKAGAPVKGLSGAGDIGRPVNDQFTRQLAFHEAEPGVYVAEAGPLDAGNWIVSLSFAGPRDNTIVYRAKERLWLKPNS